MAKAYEAINGERSGGQAKGGVAKGGIAKQQINNKAIAWRRKSAANGSQRKMKECERRNRQQRNIRRKSVTSKQICSGEGNQWKEISSERGVERRSIKHRENPASGGEAIEKTCRAAAPEITDMKAAACRLPLALQLNAAASGALLPT